MLSKENISKMMKYRWVMFAVLAIVYFFVYFHRTSLAVMAGDLMSTFGVGAGQIALLGSVYFYAYALMQIPSGVLADKYGPKKVVSVFTLVAAIGALLTGIATDFNMVILGRLLIGIGVAAVYIPIMKVLATWFRKNEFATQSGVMLAVGNIGALSAAAPLAMLNTSLGWQTVFLGLGGFSVLLAVLSYVFIKDKPSDKGFPTIAEVEALESGKEVSKLAVETQKAEAPKAEDTIGIKDAMKMVVKEKSFWALGIWFFFFYGSLMAYQGLWAGPYFQDVLGWDKLTYAGLLMFIGLGLIFGCPVAGYLADKVLKSRKKTLIIGTVLYTALWFAIWALTGVDNPLIYQVLYFLFGFFGGFFVVSYGQVKSLFPISIAGTSTAILNFFPFVGGAVLQQVCGAIIASYGITAAGGFTIAGYQTAWLTLAIGMAIATVSVYFSKEKGL
ncbi:sugar phosphate permease [Methanococcus voltae]|uniref:MFS transporter n=1 Tax=Methanococcus voltae TaxID=2188 RepID=UPI001AEB8A6E|nr:MFS transporter [Methanococcus voltae]MBP2143776.1 sugar phosphate permease [Methanococcus voltae]